MAPAGGSTTTLPPKASFLGVPRELRDMIYAYWHGQIKKISRRGTVERNWTLQRAGPRFCHPFALLSVSKAIRDEVTEETEGTAVDRVHLHALGGAEEPTFTISLFYVVLHLGPARPPIKHICLYFDRIKLTTDRVYAPRGVIDWFELLERQLRHLPDLERFELEWEQQHREGTHLRASEIVESDWTRLGMFMPENQNYVGVTGYGRIIAEKRGDGKWVVRLYTTRSDTCYWDPRTGGGIEPVFEMVYDQITLSRTKASAVEWNGVQLSIPVALEIGHEHVLCDICRASQTGGPCAKCELKASMKDLEDKWMH